MSSICAGRGTSCRGVFSHSTNNDSHWMRSSRQRCVTDTVGLDAETPTDDSRRSDDSPSETEPPSCPHTHIHTHTHTEPDPSNPNPSAIAQTTLRVNTYTLIEACVLTRPALSLTSPIIAHVSYYRSPADSVAESSTVWGLLSHFSLMASTI